MARASRLLSLLTVALAAYLAFLLARYFFSSQLPRFRVETIFFWFLAAGTAAIWTRRGTEPARWSVEDETIEWWQYAVLAVFFSAIAFEVYGPALRVGFLSDDFVLADWAARHQWVHAAETGFVRPVVPMVWAMLTVVPLRPDVTLHAANLLLHVLNAGLVVGVGLRFGLGRAEALAAGLLLLLFPALTEAIVWVSGMQDVLMTTLALISISAILSLGVAGSRPGQIGVRPRSQVEAMLVAVVASAVALGVKETAVVIPGLAWTVAWASPEGIKRGTQRATLIGITAVALLYTAYRVMAGVSPAYGQGVNRYFAKQLIVEPFATLGAPWSAAWITAHPATAYLRSSLILALMAVGFWFWRRRDRAFRRALVLAGWVLLAVLPVFSLFHVSATLEGSRYLYLPAVGFSMLLATLVGELSRRTLAAHSSGLIAALVVVLAMPSVTAIRSEVARWTEAARLRDLILDSYVELMSAARCQSIVAQGLVDNVEGAYVLRNGFTQAVASRASPETEPGEGYRCLVNWTDHIIIRQEPGG